MGERKGQNKYYPPDFDPQKHRSLDNYHGTHPLRERAKKIHQGILVIRFEMPYNIWCGGCKSHIGMGVRYNAEKSKIGNYYSTPIYKFRMKCHLCDNYMEIKTDPQNHDYVIISGARRKEQRWDPAENEQIVTEDKNDIKKRATDAMYKLEHGVDDKDKVKAAIPGLGKLKAVQSRTKDDYMLNKLARSKFRQEKKTLNLSKEADKDLLSRSSLDIQLVKETEDDIKLAALLKYNTSESYEEKQLQKRKEIESRPIFQSTDSITNNSNINSSPGDHKQNITVTKQRLSLSLSKDNPNPFGNHEKVFKKYSLNSGIVRRISKAHDDSSNWKDSATAEAKIVDVHQEESSNEERIIEKQPNLNSTDLNNSIATEKNKATNALNTLLSIYGGSSDSSNDGDME